MTNDDYYAPRREKVYFPLDSGDGIAHSELEMCALRIIDPLSLKSQLAGEDKPQPLLRQEETPG